MPNRLNKNAIAGIILLLFGVILYSYLIPTQIPQSEGMPMAMSPQLFCKISAGCLIFLSILLLFISHRIEADEEENSPSGAAQKEQWIRGTISVCLSILYIILINSLGYFVSTFFVLTAFTLFFGARNWLVIVLSELAILLFIYLLFVKGLRVILPEGLLF